MPTLDAALSSFSTRDSLFTVDGLLFIYVVVREVVMRQALSALDCVHSGKRAWLSSRRPHAYLSQEVSPISFIWKQ